MSSGVAATATQDAGVTRRALRARAITPQHVVLLNPAWICVAGALLLSILGVIMIGTTEPGLAKRQLVFMLIGLLAGGMVALPHYERSRRFAYPLLLLVTMLLVFLLIPGVPEFLVRPRNGARRWINLGSSSLQLQPSELAKIAFVIALAAYLRYRENYRRLLGLLVPFVLTFIPMGLILVEPDLGTAMLFLPTLFAMLVAAGARLKHLVLIAALGLGSAPLMYPLLQNHQKDRIQAVFSQWTGDVSRADDIAFQGDRALTLIGAGGLAGVGREHARDLIVHNALPEEHNDMIFAVICNRWGLLGGLMTLGLYLMFCIGGILTAGLCREPFGRLIAVGIVALLFAQMTINIGMTVGLTPITGMTLPFVSYGGSSLVANWLMAGLLLNIALRRPRMMTRDAFEFTEPEER